MGERAWIQRGARAVALGLVLGAGVLLALSGAARPRPTPRLRLTRVVEGLRCPVYVTGDRAGGLLILEQEGRVRRWREGQLLPRPLLDLSGAIEFGGEKGLLGLALHPRWPAEPRLFLNFTRRRARQLETVLAEFRLDPEDPDRLLPAGRELLTFSQPYGNHNGGHLDFGPDGFLYVAVGDGGAANDPHGNGQDTRTLLGSLLRLDVDGGEPYGIPRDNPFADGKGGRAELFAWGLRNPWRFSFDRQRPERLFVGDVGQDAWEEVDLVARGDDCGWNLREGRHPFARAPGPAREGLKEPIWDYDHRAGKSITGGYVYRGQDLPDLVGLYVFADFTPGPIWGLREQPDGSWRCEELAQHPFLVSSFGEDDRGELYVVDYGGAIWRVEGLARTF